MNRTMYEQICHEGGKRRPNDKLIEQLAYEYLSQFEPNKCLVEFELAQVVSVLALMYYRTNRYLQARSCLKLLHDRLKDQEYNEDAFQFSVLAHLYEDLADYEGLIKYCQLMLQKVDAYFAKELSKAEGHTALIFGLEDEPKEVPVWELIKEELENERGHLLRVTERAKKMLLDAGQCEEVLRANLAFP